MALNNREKKLMWILGGAGFLMANAFGWLMLLNARNEAIQFAAKKEAEIKKAEVLKTMVPQVAQYQGYLDQWLKRYPTMDERDTYVGNLVRGSASDLGLTEKGAPTTIEGLDEPNAQLVVGQPKPEAKFIKTGYSGEVVGDWKKVLEFAHRMEDASDFRWMKVADFQVRKSEGQDGSYDMVLKYTLQKWWHPLSEEMLAEKPEGSEAGEAPKTADTNPPAAPNDTEQAPAPPVVATGGDAAAPVVTQ
jgi:hypothetical protein